MECLQFESLGIYSIPPTFDYSINSPYRKRGLKPIVVTALFYLGFGICAVQLLVVFYQVFASHIGRLLQAHDMQYRGSYIGQTTILYGSAVIVGNVDKWYGVE